MCVVVMYCVLCTQYSKNDQNFFWSFQLQKLILCFARDQSHYKTLKQDKIKGDWKTKLPIIRTSWLCICLLISVPTQINSNALNRAWVIKWKNANIGKSTPIENIITPSWLNVDRATTFLISNSQIALIPAINKVIHEIINTVFK